MKHIKIKTAQVEDPIFLFWDDCERIVKIFLTYDYSISLTEAKSLWELVSEEYSAGWLLLPTDDVKAFEMMRPYFEDQ